jgi:hypothetical protein
VNLGEEQWTTCGNAHQCTSCLWLVIAPTSTSYEIIVLPHWQSTQSYTAFSRLLTMTTIASIIRNRLTIFDSWKCSYWFGLDRIISSCSGVLGARGASEPASPLPCPPSQLLSITVRVFHNHNRSPKIWT